MAAKPELLCPAGDRERLDMALAYGADAVYLAGNAFGMRAFAGNFDREGLAAAVEANRRVLTPLWLELIEEGRRDGSIRTEYAKELSELLPLVNFWLLPSVFPADAEEIRHKCRFVAEVLAAMGLPIIEDEMVGRTERILGGYGEERKE